jgi:hypothetical protein
MTVFHCFKKAAVKSLSLQKKSNVCFSFSGVITKKKLLPITRLNFGGTHRVNSTGMHTLGRLKCDGRLSASNKGFPTSCADLWRNGFVTNGLYSIKGSKQVEKVYCDFTKLPSEPGKFFFL